VKAEGDQSWRIALLSKRPTDVLLARIHDFPEGVYADPQMVVGRAAWYSFAYWLRTVACAKLDVDTNELQAGFRTYKDIRGPAGEAFLCDQLENGAGYSRHLAQPHIFRELLQHANPAKEEHVAHQWIAHETECDVSCNKCLRDYSNMSYHALLDWRLALDMARLAAGNMVVDLITPWGDYANPWQRLVEKIIPSTLARLGYGNRQPFGSLYGYVRNNRKQPLTLIEVHPLWTKQHPLVIQAQEAAKRLIPQNEVCLLNPFIALRRPSDYV